MLHLTVRGNGLGDLLQRVAIFGLAGRILVHPSHEIGFLLALAADDVQLVEGKLLTLPLLPAIGGTGILVGILQTDGRIGLHAGPHDTQAGGTGLHGDTVAIHHGLELVSGLEALGAARITHDKGEVTFLDTAERDLQGLLRGVGNVGGGISGRLVVLVGIDAEHGEVAGMTRPLPVVGLTTELTEGCRRSADETDIGIGLIDNQIENILVVESGNGDAAARVRGLGLGDQLLAGSLLIGSLGDGVGHIRHALQEGHGQARDRDFLVAVHGEEAILQVVVLRSGERLDIAVAAVVVGDQQTLLGNHFTGAAAAELDDGVLQGRMVDTVDLVRSQAAAEVGHGLSVHLLEQRQEPHTLIGAGAESKGREDREGT